MTTEFLAETAGMLETDKSTGVFKSFRTLPNGDTFDGLRDVISGEILFGRYTSSISTEVYTGPFWKGMRHGNGAVFFASDGSKFIGSYRKNQPHRGTWIGKEFTYTGTFYVDEDMKRIEDVNHSTRHVRMSSLNPSDFHGYGKLFLRAGNIYEGEFNHGKYHGVGKEILPDGSTYTGEFKNGERQGLGTFISCNGTCQSGVWVHDQIVNSHIADIVILPQKHLNHVEKKKKEFLSATAAESSSSLVSSSSSSTVSKKSPRNDKLDDDIDNMFDFSLTNDALPTTTTTTTRTINTTATTNNKQDTIEEEVIQIEDQSSRTRKTSDYTYIGALKNNLFHGYGSITHSKTNEIYEGEFQFGKYHGNGKLSSDNGTSEYTGDFLNGQKDGMGTIVEKNGKCYSGDWKNDQRHGEGIETLPDGELFTGQFMNNSRHGKGSLSHNGLVMEGLWESNIPVQQYDWSISYPDGRKYSGNVLNNDPHGFGQMSFTDYSLYTGHWFHGKKHGSGEMKLSSGEVMKGIWENDAFKCEEDPSSLNDVAHTPVKNQINPSSSSSSIHSDMATDTNNGNEYTGRVDKQGLRQGKGTLKTDDTEFTGTFLDNEYDGEGKLKFTMTIDNEPIKAIYQGKFSKGKFNGKGKLTVGDDIYEGDFVNGNKNGIGKEMYSNGTIYRGEYKNNKRNGIGTLQKKQCGGVVYSGSWKDDLMSGEGALFLDPPLSSEEELYVVKYEGEFIEGRKSGAGALTINDDSVLNGRWHDDKPSDYGSWMITYNDGTIYSGSIDFNDHEIMPYPEGFGTMHYINGDFYTGNFHNGKRDGMGLCLLENGDSLDGEWKNDEFVGEC